MSGFNPQGIMMLEAQFLIGFVVSLAMGLIAYFLKAISKSGVSGGVIFGTIIYTFTGWRGFLLPLTFFIIGTACTKIGYKKKETLGIAQEEGGRRGAKHALANILAGTIFGILSYLDLSDYMYYLVSVSFLVAMAGSFATAAADTASSELGQVYGKTPVNPLTFRRVKPGTEGAISLEGTLFGILASIIIAFVFVVTRFLWSSTWVFGLPIVAGAFFGNLIESYIGALGGKKLNNELLNFLNTLIGGLIAGAIFWILWIYFIYNPAISPRPII